MKALSILLLTVLVPFAEGADLRITAAARTPAGFHLRWNGNPIKTYAVQTASNPSGPWIKAGEPIPGTTNAEWTDTHTPVPNLRFYRLVESDPALDPTLPEAFRRADATPVLTAATTLTHIQTCATAIYVASSLRGAITTNGTLRQLGTQWSFDPAPANQLNVQFQSGPNLVYRTRALLGNFTGDVSTFLNSGHNFAFEVSQAGVTELAVTSQRPNGNCNLTPSASAIGTLVFSNILYTVDLQSSGPYCFEIDSTGFSLLEDYRTTGTIRADGFHLTVDYRRRYEQVGSGGEDATTEQVWLGHRLVFGADTFVWQGVSRQKSFRGGKISDWRPPGYWKAAGQILRNGAPVASYDYVPGTEAPFGFLRFIIRVGDQSIELERWL